MLSAAFHIAVQAFVWSALGALVALGLGAAFDALDTLDGGRR